MTKDEVGTNVVKIVDKVKESIIIKAGVLEALVQSEQLLDKTFPTKVNYWLARVFSKARQEFRPYMKSKTTLIEKFADEERSSAMPTGQHFILPEDRADFNEKLEELVLTEIDLGINKIEVDVSKLPSLSVKEMEMLLPILDVKGV